MNQACIVGAVRSPLGRHGGVLSSVRPDDLAAHVLRSLVARLGIDPAAIDDVFMGCANQAGEDNRDIARMAALLAGFPTSVPGVTVNRLCGSGMEAVAQAARAVMVGDAACVIGAGVESMSRAPWVVPKPGRAFPTGPPAMEDTTLGWRLVNPRMRELGHTDALGITAETLAEQYGITRLEQDRFALASQAKAAVAVDSNRFDDEIVPVDVDLGRNGIRTLSADETPRPGTTLDQLASLPPAFKPGGTVTAGNSSGLNDGAAAVAICSPAFAADHDLPVLAVIQSIATAGVDPRVMGLGPVPASAQALSRVGMTLDDVDVIELNEAFAAQALAVLREWDIASDDARLNPHGGAIALGHPLGCSGTRLVATLAHELHRDPDTRVALAAMCIGVGQGIAMVLTAP
jgi:acetyl-CoA acyltransferase